MDINHKVYHSKTINKILQIVSVEIWTVYCNCQSGYHTCVSVGSKKFLRFDNGLINKLERFYITLYNNMEVNILYIYLRIIGASS